jgi:hypothetical protein
MTLSTPKRSSHAESYDRTMALPERGPKTTDAPVPVRIYVDVNTYVVRTDLGLNRFTFVAAGDAVPVGLEGFPRVPA